VELFRYPGKVPTLSLGLMSVLLANFVSSSRVLTTVIATESTEFAKEMTYVELKSHTSIA
jgi:hypothetical protein